MDKDPQLSAIDAVMMILLKEFIKQKFPSEDPKMQITAAYTYAALINETRKSEEALNATDAIMLMLLQDFIKERYPSTDPRQQVTIAYVYAALISQFRNNPFPNGKSNVCPKCNGEVKTISLATFDHPEATVTQCVICGLELNRHD